MRDREIVLFLGAGASKLYGLPTVEEFFAQVEGPRDGGFKTAYEQLARHIAIQEGTAQDMKWPKYDAEKLFGNLEQWVNTSNNIGVPPIVKLERVNMAIPAADLLAHLKSEIVRIYGHTPAWDPRDRYYADLFSLILQKKTRSAPIWIITTNYDSILEGFLRDVNFINRIHYSIAGAPDLRTGFVPGTPALWRPEMFTDPPRSGFCPINLVKLHGSVTWKWKDEGGVRKPVDIGLAVPTRDYDCLVYFGYKSIPEIDPFKTLHDRLKKILLTDALVVCIGFRFGDPYIRETFDFALRANGRLQVVCSVTRQPPPGSPLSELMTRFPNQVSLLVGADGAPLPFGHDDFCKELEKRFESIL
jgi:hypothetical protein